MIRWKRKLKTLLAVTLMFSLAVCLLPATAVAAANVDLDAKGNITVELGDSEYRHDLTDPSLEKKVLLDIDIYRVGDIGQYGGYTVAADYAALLPQELADKMAAFGTDTTAKDMEELTESLVAVLAPKTKGDAPAAAVQPDYAVQVGIGETIMVDGLGLPVGLYVFITHDITVGEYVYSFLPLLLSLPSLGQSADAANPDRGNSADGNAVMDWLYDYTIYMKATRETAKGQIYIQKDLDSWNASLGPVTFVFEVTVQEPGKAPYTKMYSLTFDGTEFTKWVLVDGLPVGSTVSVVEKYSGQSYGGGVVGDNTVVIVPVDEDSLDLPGTINGIPVVYFDNTYDGGLIPNDGVVNRFTLVEGGFGYDWTPVSDSSTDLGGIAG